MTHIYYFLIVLLITVSPTFAQAKDSLVEINAKELSQNKTEILLQDSDIEEFDDGAPGLGIAVLLVFFIIIIAIAAAVFLSIIVLLLFFGLVAMGILSASLLIGLEKKSFSKGFKTFVITSSTVAGFFAGPVLFYILNRFLEYWSASTSILLGLFSGIIAGFFIGLLIFTTIQKITRFFKSRMIKTTK